MENQLIESDITSTSATLANTSVEFYDKAWCLLGILLTIGHPLPPIELASRCISFQTSPEFVEFICSIPNSPLVLTSDQFVTLSTVAFVAFRRFFINTNVISEIARPRLRLGDIMPKRVWENVEQTYSRKRMRLRSDVIGDDHLPLLKKRAVLRNVEAEKDCYVVMGLPASARAGLQKIRVSQDVTERSFITHQGELSVMKANSVKPDEEATTSSQFNFSAGPLRPLSYELNNDEPESEWKADISATKKDLGCIYKSGLQYRFQTYERLPHVPNIILEGVKACMPYQETFYLTRNPTEKREDTVNSTYFLSLNSSSSSCLEVEGHKPIPPAEAENAIYSSKPVNPNVNTEDLQINFYGMDINIVRCNDLLPSLGKRTISCQEVCEQNLISPVESEFCEYHSRNVELHEDAEKKDEREELFISSGNGIGVKNMPVISPSMEMPCEEFRSKPTLMCNNTPTALDREETAADLLNLVSVDMIKQPTESYGNSKIDLKNVINPRAQTISKLMERRNTSSAQLELQQCTIDKKPMSMKQKLKQNYDPKTHMIEKKENSVENKEKSSSMKNQLEPKALPIFDSFIVEEEEGSGGYGTVYKAKRKKDGEIFAVKCPHVNANRHHVQNELKMLERFGGKNFVIKYEGSFKRGNSDCLVLEHFEHDRPEVLKREIDIFELQWYGFCLFRALNSLHKQGVVHRDIKPGNFLFSRKVNKGYLIDFNLALDVHQKYGSTEKSGILHDLSLGQLPIPCSETLISTKSRKRPSSKAFEAVNQEAGNYSKSLSFSKNLKKKTDRAKGHTDLSKNRLLRSQCADGSGITSAKDATSTRLTSAERLREPIIYKGRRTELISLAQEVMQSPNHKVINMPASKRKRVAAPPAKVDKDFVYLTPMPLQSTGVAAAGAGLFKSKGEGKHKKEGPCVGTKGFRAPEILVRSAYQGPKVDIWSAGVTLLYLITGRAPFVGDPDQNIKEIAKLRGSEDVWEVAKLHNRESSFPVDLFDIQSLPSMKLRDWCKLNTRRGDFHELIPRSLFDLVDKCLTVNPRLRISAEEALRHEFFAPCIESLKKQRLLRQGSSSLDSGGSALVQLDTQLQTCQGLS